jgi:hypothetical protein
MKTPPLSDSTGLRLVRLTCRNRSNTACWLSVPSARSATSMSRAASWTSTRIIGFESLARQLRSSTPCTRRVSGSRMGAPAHAYAVMFSQKCSGPRMNTASPVSRAVPTAFVPTMSSA